MIFEAAFHLDLNDLPQSGTDPGPGGPRVI
jgi:hypothetical protein